VWPAWATYAGVKANAWSHWVNTTQHAYADYEIDVAAAEVATTAALAPANVQYAHDVAQAWSGYHVTVTGLARDMHIAGAQLNVAQVNAANPSSYAYIEPYNAGGSGMMMWGVSAITYAYSDASNFLGTIGISAATYAQATTAPANPSASSAPAAVGGGGANGVLLSMLGQIAPAAAPAPAPFVPNAPFYIDFGYSLPLLDVLGVGFGLQVDFNNGSWHPYVGGGVTTGGGSITVAPFQSVTPGWQGAGGGGAVLGGQFGWTFGGIGFLEIGAVSPGASIMAFYVF
jgi:hypothetical protein